MADKNIALMAHLMRRAGFGADREELEARVKKGYEATVEELLDPDTHGIPEIDDAVVYRHNPGFYNAGNQKNAGGYWMYRMVNTKRPLEEKVALLWHQIFATGLGKVGHPPEMLAQIEMFRKIGMGSYHTLLVELSKNPAMILWLDNQENHKDSVNENWGRELLELFSMGHSNYTEEDVKEVARAFTGWTIAPRFEGILFNRFPWEFEYRAEDHDDGEKVILGHRGRYNGEDVIDLIMKHPATTRFVARHLYNFFVADEVQVPSWQDVAPRDPVAINIIGEAFQSSDYDIRSTLRVLFNSDFFKDEKVWFGRVKSPTELVVGTMRLIGSHQFPQPGITKLEVETDIQGQAILNPPSVEGWHTGAEWINSGSLVSRVNFSADNLGDVSFPGIKSIVERLAKQGDLTPENLLDGCLDLIGPVTVGENIRQELIDHVESGGGVARVGTTDEENEIFAHRVGQALQLIAATREYQLT
ncbi:DUF1800 domain-containing protein [SAR202 cluster bacterium AC-409-J13_OGT_754m]|nr:DUF1800 domain-containing protein [SAR202 cluster bacterium AC-409-J13_OGT_754m]